MTAAAGALLALTLLAGRAPGAAYTAGKVSVDGVEVVRLADSRSRVQVSILPSMGNLVYEMSAGGSNVLWFPYAGPAEFRAAPKLCGIPFLAPWANRLRHDAFRANGKKYALNAELGNLRRDPEGRPLHGLLAFSPHWRVAALEAGGGEARVRSRLEFWRHPELMAQFPFAHAIEMTHRLHDGILQVETVLENLSEEPLPVAIGYHPYLRLPGVPREAWQANLPARERFVAGPDLLPTGGREPVEPSALRLFPGLPRGEAYADLQRDREGGAEFVIAGGGMRISVSMGPRYRVALVYAPPGGEFICIEPMTAPVDGFNLAHEGKYGELQSVPPGGRWQERFRVKAERKAVGRQR